MMELDQITPFMYGKNGQQVRTALGPDGEPWFVLVDVCEILEINHPATLLRRLDDDEHASARVKTGKLGEREVTVISEAGVFQVVMRSNRPEAKALRRFIAHDILPAIRRTGFYGTNEWKAELANTTAMISGSMSSALEVLRKIPGGEAERVVAHLEQVRQERVLGDLVGICGGAEAYRALL